MLPEGLDLQQDCGPRKRAAHASTTRYLSAKSLIVHWEEGEPVLFNFLSKHSISASQDVLDLISFFSEARTAQNAFDCFTHMDHDDLDTALTDLTSLGFLHILGDETTDMFDRWKWSLPSAIFHFSANNCQFVSYEDSQVIQRGRLSDEPQPALVATNNEYDEVIDLPTVSDEPLLSFMSMRRTCRDFSDERITRSQLAKCLFAGLGVTGWTSNCVGRLPLKMTPSGGARNPYEAFILVRDVKELESNVYHYSASEHSLGKLDRSGVPLPSDLLGSQDWTDGACCIVFLCAMFERSMWKYRDNNAYRVMLIEAGHIAQNMMLAATDEGFSASPTAALAHDDVSLLIGNSDPLISPIYAIALGYPNVWKHRRSPICREYI